MGERSAYYRRIALAVNDPDNYMSLIIDGMARHHCQVPSASNLSSFNNHLDQKITGCINHGREFVIFRNYTNLGKTGANLTIHVILTMIERTYLREKRLPGTLFIQIDGGGENANTTLLAFCSLLAVRFKHIGLREVYLTRLPPGHTHEDIDGKFARIWVKIRNTSILTPSQFANILESLFKNSKLPFKLIDVFVLPNYRRGLDEVTDPELAGWSKTNKFQAQWIFKVTDRTPTNLLGVQVEYKAFCQDKCFVIVKEMDKFNPKCIGIKPVERVNPVYGLTEFLGIITDYPSFEIEPAPFCKDWKLDLDKVIAEVTAKYDAGNSQSIKPEVMTEWYYFRDMIMPQGDSVTEYLKIHPLHIPMHKLLYGPESEISQKCIDALVPPSKVRLFNGEPIKTVRSQPCVRHSGNKHITPLPPTLPVNTEVTRPLSEETILLKRRWSEVSVKEISDAKLIEHIKEINSTLPTGEKIVVSTLKNKKMKLERIQMHYDNLGK